MAQHLVEKKGLRNHEFGRTVRMGLYGGGTSLPSPRSSPARLTRLRPSHLRPGRDQVVPVPAEQDRAPEQEARDRSARRRRPDRLRVGKPGLVPQQHGHHGRRQPQGEAGEELRVGAEEQLDGVAVGAGGQLLRRAVAASRPGRQCHLAGLELLLELHQQQVKEGNPRGESRGALWNGRRREFRRPLCRAVETGKASRRRSRRLRFGFEDRISWIEEKELEQQNGFDA